ncbi:MAG: hypothetical protein JSS76_11420 [Bacteroidetes bacterium]|nr:hypothetical protein [Bacteroidota bacterium]
MGKSDLEKDLSNLIVAFQKKFPGEGEAYSYLYNHLKQRQQLDLKQCKCVGQHISTFYKNHRSYFGRNKYSGASGYPLYTVTNPSKRSNIPKPLPDSLKKPETGVFAECKYCNKRYTITAGTIFHGNNTPLRSQLAMLLIAEYYNFDPAKGEDILNAFKSVMSNTDLIKSTFSEKLKEESSSSHTLRRYRDLFIATENLKQLDFYNLSDYLQPLF